MRALTTALLVVALAGCKTSSPPPSAKTKLGPFPAEEWRELTPAGLKLRCYLLGAQSNAPVRLCGEGATSPDGQNYLIEAVPPAPGAFSQSGPLVEPGWYLLRPVSASKVDAWKLGRLGAHEWLGGGKTLLAVNTDATTHVTHIRLLDPVARTDRAFAVPYSKSEGFVTVRAPGDTAVLLLQRVGLEQAILVRAPLSGAYVETLDIASSDNTGAKKLWAKSEELREHGGIPKVNASVLSAISWKNGEPLFDEMPLGPFDLVEEGKDGKQKK